MNNAATVGYRVVTKNTTYLLTKEEGGRFMFMAISEPRTPFALSASFRHPISVVPSAYPPEAGRHLSVARAGDDWPKWEYKWSSSITTTRIQEVWPLTEDDLTAYQSAGAPAK